MITDDEVKDKIQGLQKDKETLQKELEIVKEECKIKDQEIQDISFKLKSKRDFEGLSNIIKVMMTLKPLHGIHLKTMMNRK